jgi:hypothetical protein
MFTKGRFNQPNYGTKDFTDYRAMNGHKDTVKLIETITDKYQEVIDFFLEYNYNSLKNIE